MCVCEITRRGCCAVVFSPVPSVLPLAPLLPAVSVRFAQGQCMSFGLLVWPRVGGLDVWMYGGPQGPWRSLLPDTALHCWAMEPQRQEAVIRTKKGLTPMRFLFLPYSGTLEKHALTLRDQNASLYVVERIVILWCQAI